MSFILEALKRSEAERQRQQAEAVISPALAEMPARRARNWAPWLAVALLINALLMLALFWPSREPAPDAVTLSPPPPVPASPEAARAAPTDSNDSAAAPSLPEPRPGALAEAAGYGRKAPEAKPADTQRSTEAPRPAVAPPSPPAAEPATTTAPDSTKAPLLAELPDAVRAGIPPIPVNIHVYAPEPASRFVLIDMRRYTEGQTLHSGPRLEAITADGLVLKHQGRRFRIQVR